MNDANETRLVACLADVERHVRGLGWDQPARLFALVETRQLLELEPQLKDRVPQAAPDALTAIEQEEFANGQDPIDRLTAIYWPETVLGAALALERSFLPPEHEAELPSNPEAATEFVSSHPDRTDLRVVVGVLRDGTHHGLGRLTSDPEELLGAPDLVPGLAQALLRTFEES